MRQRFVTAALAALTFVLWPAPAARADDVTDAQLRGRRARVRVNVNVGPQFGTGFGGDPFAAYGGFGGAFGTSPYGFGAPAFAPRQFVAIPFRGRFGRLCVFVPGLGTFCR